MDDAMRRRLQRRVLDWFAVEARDYPWRRTRDPYRTLVAEVMLQQTQTARVAGIYESFLARFPDVAALAAASPAGVIEAWGGLGYNRRAIALHRAAREIVARYDGVPPRSPERLRALPGVGPYTASAVACFAYDAQVPVVDVNVRRVLSRAAAGREPHELPVTVADALAAGWLPRGSAYAWNQALMDIGSRFCRTRPTCDPCPLAGGCARRASGGGPPSRPPRKQPKFAGSARQVRGIVVEHLRRSGGRTTHRALARAVAIAGPEAASRGLTSILLGLERDGLVVLGPAARAGSPGGRITLPG